MNSESIQALKAKTACERSNRQVADHFADVSEMVDLGSGSQREVEDIMRMPGVLLLMTETRCGWG